MPDFTDRADLEEQMDGLTSFAEYRTCLHDLDSVSRTVLAHRPTLNFLNRAANLSPNQPLRILDVACGDGSMLRRIAQWAKSRNLKVELQGLDLNPNAIAVAHEFPNASPPIEYLISDVFAYNPPQLPDIILSAHFTHHLSSPDLIRFLRWMEQTARFGWFVNDLHRHPNPYRLFRLLGSFAPWHKIVVSDGLISIRRAFVPEDWRNLLQSAQIAGAMVTEEFPARLTVSRIRAAKLD